MIVKAKMRRIEDLPAAYKCCQQAIDSSDLDEELFIETSTIHVTTDTCNFCGKGRPMSATAQIIGEPIGNEIILECYELDEGETTPAELFNRGVYWRNEACD